MISTRPPRRWAPAALVAACLAALSSGCGTSADSTGGGAASGSTSGKDNASSGASSGSDGGALSGSSGALSSSGTAGLPSTSGSASGSSGAGSASGGLDSGVLVQDASSGNSAESGEAGGPPVVDAAPPGGPIQYTGPRVTGTLKINRASPTGRLVPGYAGFSFEKSHMTDGFFTGANAPLIEMFKLLGPGYLRLGGHDVDSRHWMASATPVPGGTTSQMVGTADVDGLSAFLRATGWKAIYGLNLQSETSATNDVAEATYVASALGSNLHSFEIGNEWGSTLEARWRTFADAIKAALPATQQTGPGACCGTAFPVSFAANEASRLVLLTYHHYVGVAGAGATIAAVLNTDNGLVADTKQLVAAAASNGIAGGFRWGEINTYAHHGQAGVSDAYAAALWGIDNMLTSAELGAVGVNYHGGGQNMDGNNCPSGPSSCSAPFRYSPIVEVNSQVTAAAPLFYAMLFVSRAGTGAMFPTALTVPNNLNVTAYAIGPADGSTYVAIVNKDSANGFEATVDVGGAVAAATGDYMQGQALNATSGVTFAGAGVTATGAWTPQPAHGLPTSGNTFTVVVPPTSAVLVHAR